jgi:hypothetical protein
MRRRDFIQGTAVSFAWPLAAHAQQHAMTRVGIVTIQPPTSPPFAAFTQRLNQLGYVEGQNLRLDFINPEMQAGGNAGAVQELIRRKVDIILANYQPTRERHPTPTVPVTSIALSSSAIGQATPGGYNFLPTDPLYVPRDTKSKDRRLCLSAPNKCRAHSVAASASSGSSNRRGKPMGKAPVRRRYHTPARSWCLPTSRSG